MISKPSHKVIITISSKDDEPTVNLQVNWEPLLNTDQVTDLGFVPAAYKLAQHLLFATEDLIDNEQMLEIEEGDLDASRSIN